MAKAGGRRSLADLNAATFTPEIQPTRALSSAEAKVWRRAISSWPPEHWIGSDADLLTQYVAINCLLDAAFEERDLAAADKLGKLVLAYARSLRITNQSRFDARAAARAADRGREGEAANDRLLGGSAWETH
jgi:hypothetical protein